MVNMKKKIYFNIVLTLLIVAVAFGWMVTEISRGEMTDYERRLVITALDIDVYLYQYIGDEYVLVTDPIINIGSMAPGDKLQFRFDVVNNNDNISTSKIVFSKITGDLDSLGDIIKIGSSSPKVLEYSINSKIETQTNNDKIFRFYDNFEVKPNSTASLYWYISLDKQASNEVANKTLSIGSIRFVKP